jgi:hypothetical protein
MRIRRTLPLVLAVVAVAAALTLAVQLRKSAPPEAARLLPGGDAFFYVNLSWVRKAGGGNALPAVSHDPAYEKFIAQTGIQFERDLDAAAFSVHYPATWAGSGTGGAAPEARFSEVFIGKFHGEKLTNYLRQIAKAVETYNSVDIFTIPLDDRMFRVAVLSVDSVAASNHDDAAVIRGIVDRSRRLASPFGGPAFLRRYYKRVQLASPVWLVARIQPSAAEFGGWDAVFSKPADLVISLSFNPLHLPLHPGALHLRAEAQTASTEDARAISDKLGVVLSMFHAAETSSRGNDPDVKIAFDSLQVHQDGDRAVLSATLPAGFLHKMFSEAPSELALPGSQPPTTPTPRPH